MFEAEMSTSLTQAKESCDGSIMKTDYRRLIENCVKEFKSKAVGQELDEFENSLRAEMEKKFDGFWKQFITYCWSIAQAYTTESEDAIRWKINSNAFASVQEFSQELKSFWDDFTQNGPNFEGWEAFISEMCEGLSIRFAEAQSFSQKSKATSEINILEQRLEKAEEEKQKLREEFMDQTQRMNDRIDELEQER